MASRIDAGQTKTSPATHVLRLFAQACIRHGLASAGIPTFIRADYMMLNTSLITP